MGTSLSGRLLKAHAVHVPSNQQMSLLGIVAQKIPLEIAVADSQERLA